MKKISVTLVCFIFVILLGFREYSEKQIVKLVTIDDNNITMYCYDYSKEEPSYTKYTMKNNGTENTLAELLSQRQYNLKLCRYVVCDEIVIDNDINDVFSALIQSKFSPDIAVIKGDTNESEKYIDNINDLYPLYGYKIVDDKIYGVVRDADEGVNNIIADSMLYTTLDKEHSFVFDILAGHIKNGIYTFKKDNKIYTAELERMSVYNTVVNDILNVNITANLKSYKGMPAGKVAKKEFETYLCESIKHNAADIYNDKIIADVFNLDWYRKVEKYTDVKINVYVI